MTDYRRFLSYIYAYDGDLKMNGTGFAKMEVRDDRYRLTVNLGCTLPANGKNYHVAVYGGDIENPVIADIGLIEQKGNGYLLKLSGMKQGFASGRISIEDACGLIVYKEAGSRIHITSWKDPQTLVRALREEIYNLRNGSVIKSAKPEADVINSKLIYINRNSSIEADENKLQEEELQNEVSGSKTDTQGMYEETDNYENIIIIDRENINLSASENNGREEVLYDKPELEEVISEEAESEEAVHGEVESEEVVHEKVMHEVALNKESGPEEVMHEAAKSEEAEHGEVESEEVVNEKVMHEVALNKESEPEEAEHEEAKQREVVREEAEPEEAESEEVESEEATREEVESEKVMHEETIQKSKQEEAIYGNVGLKVVLHEADIQSEDSTAGDVLSEDKAEMHTSSEDMPTEHDDRPLHAMQTGELWHDFKRMYPKIQPFNEAGWEVLQIRLQDIGRLCRENWILGNNNFVLHGYYKYGYLILARKHKPDMDVYILGVPGTFSINEKFMASMFGLTDFMDSNCKRPDLPKNFGYWCTHINM